ncbi:MAG: sugar phosphate isomerase/epimerase family protein [Saccharofermentanales bacterium]|jgi:L-ribulose-5-phosphate 3-epimerase
MKQGYSFFSFGGDIDMKEYLAECSEAGYDGVELVINDCGALTMDSSEKAILEVKRMVEDFGLEIIAVGASIIWNYNIASDDPIIRRKSKEIVEKQLSTAALLGADSILVIPGMVGSDFALGKTIPYERAYENSQEVLSSIIPFARDCKVSMAIENVWNKFLLSPLEMRRFIDEINSPFLGAYFDIGNILYIGYPDDWIRTLGNRIKKIHFSDFKKGGGTLASFCDLLEGDVDYRAVMSALRDTGYDDYVTLEMFPNYPVFPKQTIKSGKLAMDLILTL